jgi:hypothetical protein
MHMLPTCGLQPTIKGVADQVIVMTSLMAPKKMVFEGRCDMISTFGRRGANWVCRCDAFTSITTVKCELRRLQHVHGAMHLADCTTLDCAPHLFYGACARTMCSDGCQYPWLIKPGDDLRKDHRLLELAGLANSLVQV